jgi:histidinol phosphatase-like enzyme (inositol monophosphatase family)
MIEIHPGLPRTPAVVLDEQQRREFVSFLREVVLAAGPITLSHFRASIHVANKQAAQGTYDPVTQADQDAESCMRDLISERYPEHGVFGEEHGFKAGSCGLTWVIDPIDGTRAFITGQLHWGVLVALYDGQKPLLGAMFQPFTGELFIADGTSSALERDGQRSALKVRPCAGLDEAILCCTTPEMFTTMELQAFEQLVERVRLRRFGGDCYSYCMLAHGLADLVVEADLKPYDIQALIPICESAGGVVTDWSGGSAAHGGRVIAAGDRRVHAAALAVLSRVEAGA